MTEHAINIIKTEFILLNTINNIIIIIPKIGADATFIPEIVAPLFLEKYSQSELNRKIAEAEKKIDEIKNKLKANLESQKAYLEISYDGKYFAQPDKNQTVQKEKVSVYKNDFSALFS